MKAELTQEALVKIFNDIYLKGGKAYLVNAGLESLLDLYDASCKAYDLWLDEQDANS